MRRRVRLIVLVLMVAVLSVTLVACAPPFKDAPQGLSEDNREFKAIADKRMDAVAPDYKGYIYKQDEEAFCFRLKSPTKIEQGKKYPIIIFLHGRGDWGSDNSKHMFKSLMDNAAKYVNEEVFVFMPQAIKNYAWEEDRDDYQGMSKLYNSALDELIKTFAVDTDRVYLTGMSMGGFGTFYQAYNNPGKYAAIAPICGYYPENIFSDLAVIKDMPIWLGHSKTDDVVDFKESENMFRRLLSAGAKDIKTTWPDKYQHDMTEPFYSSAEFWQWLMSHSK